MPAVDDAPITTAELAAQLRVDVATARRWVASGLVPGAVRLPGGGYRLPADAAAHVVQPVSKEAVSA